MPRSAAENIRGKRHKRITELFWVELLLLLFFVGLIIVVFLPLSRDYQDVRDDHNDVITIIILIVVNVAFIYLWFV